MDNKASSGGISMKRIIQILIAFGGIYASFITNVYALEKLTVFTKKGNPDPIIVTIVCQDFLSCLVALFVNKVIHRRKNPQPVAEQVQMGFLTVCTMILSLKVLNFLSTPVTNLVKSSKSLSILLMGLISGKIAVQTSQISSVVLVTGGILLFNVLQDSGNASTHSTLIGYVMAGASLIVDGLLANAQGASRKKHQTQAYDMMQTTNMWAGIFALIYGLVTNEIIPPLNFLLKDSDAFLYFILTMTTGTVGQIFIYYTIVNFTPLFLSIVTSSRKFFSIALSIFLFNHQVNLYQWFAISLVFAGVAVEVYQKAKEAPAAQPVTTIKQEKQK